MSQNLKLLVGLGNPGTKYTQTRHNIGFLVMDALAKTANWKEGKKFQAAICQTDIEGSQVILAKPLTFMNNSGQAVVALGNYYKLSPDDIWIVHDEIDLPFGAIKISQDSSSAGHNGIESIIQHLGTKKFVRFRLGVKNDILNQVSADKYVLQKFKQSEMKQIPKIIDTAVQAISTAITSGIVSAMNKYNKKGPQLS